MELEQAERFVAAAERDYLGGVTAYRAILGEEYYEHGERPEWRFDVDALRVARADVLAAQQVLDLAREERRLAERRAEEEAACPRCGRVVGRARLFDSWGRGVQWCADCDACGAQEAER